MAGWVQRKVMDKEEIEAKVRGAGLEPAWDPLASVETLQMPRRCQAPLHRGLPRSPG